MLKQALKSQPELKNQNKENYLDMINKINKISTAIKWLEIIDRCQFQSPEQYDVEVLPFLEDFDGEYHLMIVMWNEQKDWKEYKSRKYPQCFTAGDIILMKK